MSSWADAADEEPRAQAAPPEESDPPPPGFSASDEGAHNPSLIEAQAGSGSGSGSAAGAGVEDGVDKPDIALKSEGLQEEEGEEVQAEVRGDAESIYKAAETFEDLGLSKELLEGLYSGMKFQAPSKIQARTLPLILSPPYSNIVAQGHNGSGKTTCFTLSMLSRVDVGENCPQALCICPTRELAMQNYKVMLKMAQYTSITSKCTASEEYGGGGRGAGVEKAGASINEQVIIGTPGTLKNWITSGRKPPLDVTNLKILVFDEADQMLDANNFKDMSLRIIKAIEDKKNKAKGAPPLQILLFSATFSDVVKEFTSRVVGNDAHRIWLPASKLSLDVIKQYRVVCPREEDKVDVLKERIFPLAERLGQCIIFVRTRPAARHLHNELANEGHKCTSIHGDQSFQERDQVVKEFRDGTTKILIATNVMARGFDVSTVTLVVNYEPPTVNGDGQTPDPETYMHRIGRSGRFGRKGAAFNLVTEHTKQVDVLGAISGHFQREVKDVPFDDDDAFEEVLKEAGLA
ncbi:DEAD-box ATP-dependent RNA helicase 38 [Pseudoscourfieldia marina]